MKFRQYFDYLNEKKRKKYFSSFGERYGKNYKLDIVDGVEQLVPTDEVTDYQAYIDSFAEMQDIHALISRYVNGDASAINPASPHFGDFTNVPSTYAEIFQRVRECENFFDSLPSELKEKFDNSYTKFWSQFGSTEFDSIINAFDEKFNVSGNFPSADVEKGDVDNAE